MCIRDSPHPQRFFHDAERHGVSHSCHRSRGKLAPALLQCRWRSLLADGGAALGRLCACIPEPPVPRGAAAVSYTHLSGVVILAATNRPETLDKALLRPGRFDRRVPVELPDLQGREAILRVHAKDVMMADDIDYKAVARATSGASGAELANLINEAALRAVKCLSLIHI